MQIRSWLEPLILGTEVLYALKRRQTAKAIYTNVF